MYWIDSATHILTCPRTGCDGASPDELVTDFTNKADPRVDDAGLYWTVRPSFEAGEYISEGPLHFCAFAECAANHSVVLIDKKVAHYELNGPFIYWTETSTDVGAPHSVQRLAKPSL